MLQQDWKTHTAKKKTYNFFAPRPSSRTKAGKKGLQYHGSGSLEELAFKRYNRARSQRELFQVRYNLAR